jgi:hypothetical protein
LWSNESHGIIQLSNFKNQIENQIETEKQIKTYNVKQKSNGKSKSTESNIQLSTPRTTTALLMRPGMKWGSMVTKHACT